MLRDGNRLIQADNIQNLPEPGSYEGALVYCNEVFEADYSLGVVMAWQNVTYDIGDWRTGANTSLIVPPDVTAVVVECQVKLGNLNGIGGVGIAEMYLQKNGDDGYLYVGGGMDKFVAFDEIVSPVLKYSSARLVVEPGDVFTNILYAPDPIDIEASLSWFAIRAA